MLKNVAARYKTIWSKKKFLPSELFAFVSEFFLLFFIFFLRNLLIALIYCHHFIFRYYNGGKEAAHCKSSFCSFEFGKVTVLQTRISEVFYSVGAFLKISDFVVFTAQTPKDSFPSLWSHLFWTAINIPSASKCLYVEAFFSLPWVKYLNWTELKW